MEKRDTPKAKKVLLKDHQFVFTTWRFRTEILLYFTRCRLTEKEYWQTESFRLSSFNTSETWELSVVV